MKTDATSSDRHEHDASGLNPLFLGHANFPQGSRPLGNPDAASSAVGGCGDRLTVQIQVEGDCIKDIRALPNGCVYTVACASALCGLAAGRSISQALELQPEMVAEKLGGLPEDHLHCARLAVNTLGEAIDVYLQQRWGPKPVNFKKGADMRKILVVTETPPRFTDFARVLREEGAAECLWAETPEAGLDMAAQNRPDFVVVDENIAGTPGLEWVKRLLTVNAFLNTGLVSPLDDAAFHEACEGLGIALGLSTEPGESDARKVLGWLASS